MRGLDAKALRFDKSTPRISDFFDDQPLCGYLLGYNLIGDVFFAMEGSNDHHMLSFERRLLNIGV